MKLQASEASNLKNLRSQIAGSAENRLSLRVLRVVHDRLFHDGGLAAPSLIQQHNRRLSADRPMWAFFVVVLAPILQFFLGVCKAHEPMSIQTFRSEPAVECFDEGIVGGLAWSGKVMYL